MAGVGVTDFRGASTGRNEEDVLQFEICGGKNCVGCHAFYGRNSEKKKVWAYCGAPRRVCGEAIACGRVVARVDAPRVP